MKENKGGTLTPYAGIGDDKNVVDLEEYARTTRACHLKLQSIWFDLELSAISQSQQLDEITQRALFVWTAAVEHAETHRESVRHRIEEACAEIRKISEQLGERTAFEESQTSMGSLIIPGKSIKVQYDEIYCELENWKRKRQDRVDEYDKLVAEVNSIKERLGLPHYGAAKKGAKSSSISRASMEFLRLELERMRGEKVRKERKMEATLGKLRKLCIELSADDTEVAASVHPSLRGYHNSMPGHYYSYTSYKPDHEPTVGLPQVDLGDSTFAGLEDKVEEMQLLKESRDSRATEMLEVLRNMWTMLEVPYEDESRDIFEKLLEAPSRLHANTLEKCGEEIGRLEGCQAKVMKAMIIHKEKEMAALCEATCLPAPDLSLLTQHLDAGSSGHVADALSKLIKMIAEVKLIVERREPVIKTIHEVEESFKEIRWHYQHQQEVVYNSRGRDANRLLQRAIKAEDRRKKLPKLMGKLTEALTAWEDSEGRPFMLGRFAYQDDVLAIIQEEITLMDRVKPKKPEAKPAKKARGGHAAAANTSAPAEPSVPESEALKRIAAVHANSSCTNSGSLRSRTASLNDSTPTADTTMLTPQPFNAQCTNPLQDLVNSLANASAMKRMHQNSANRYVQPPVLAPLHIEDPHIDDPHIDQPNMASAVVSPVPDLELLSQGVSISLQALQAEDGSAPMLNGCLSLPRQSDSPKSPSVLASSGSDSFARRSVHSEALTHINSNVMSTPQRSGITMRKKAAFRPKTPLSAARKSKSLKKLFPDRRVQMDGTSQEF